MEPWAEPDEGIAPLRKASLHGKKRSPPRATMCRARQIDVDTMSHQENMKSPSSEMPFHEGDSSRMRLLKMNVNQWTGKKKGSIGGMDFLEEEEVMGFTTGPPERRMSRKQSMSRSSILRSGSPPAGDHVPQSFMPPDRRPSFAQRRPSFAPGGPPHLPQRRPSHAGGPQTLPDRRPSLAPAHPSAGERRASVAQARASVVHGRPPRPPPTAPHQTLAQRRASLSGGALAAAPRKPGRDSSFQGVAKGRPSQFSIEEDAVATIPHRRMSRVQEGMAVRASSIGAPGGSLSPQKLASEASDPMRRKGPRGSIVKPARPSALLSQEQIASIPEPRKVIPLPPPPPEPAPPPEPPSPAVDPEVAHIAAKASWEHKVDRTRNLIAQTAFLKRLLRGDFDLQSAPRVLQQEEQQEEPPPDPAPAQPEEEEEEEEAQDEVAPLVEADAKGAEGGEAMRDLLGGYIRRKSRVVMAHAPKISDDSDLATMVRKFERFTRFALAKEQQRGTEAASPRPGSPGRGSLKGQGGIRELLGHGGALEPASGLAVLGSSPLKPDPPRPGTGSPLKQSQSLPAKSFPGMFTVWDLPEYPEWERHHSPEKEFSACVRGNVDLPWEMEADRPAEAEAGPVDVSVGCDYPDPAREQHEAALWAELVGDDDDADPEDSASLDAALLPRPHTVAAVGRASSPSAGAGVDRSPYDWHETASPLGSSGVLEWSLRSDPGLSGETFPLQSKATHAKELQEMRFAAAKARDVWCPGPGPVQQAPLQLDSAAVQALQSVITEHRSPHPPPDLAVPLSQSLSSLRDWWHHNEDDDGADSWSGTDTPDRMLSTPGDGRGEGAMDGGRMSWGPFSRPSDALIRTPVRGLFPPKPRALSPRGGKSGPMVMVLRRNGAFVGHENKYMQQIVMQGALAASMPEQGVTKGGKDMEQRRVKGTGQGERSSYDRWRHHRALGLQRASEE